MNAPDGLPRIVIVDHYDSYTRNLIPLIASCFDPPPDPELLARRVTVIPHTLAVFLRAPRVFVTTACVWTSRLFHRHCEWSHALA